MEQIKQTVLSAGKDAWNFLTGVTMSAAQSVSCAVSQTVGFAGEKLGELTKKYRQPLLSAGKAVSVAAALVSMLSLETAMLHAFGSENSESFRQTMTFFTGTGVCTLVLVIGIYMIVRSTKALRKPDSGCR